MQTIGTVYPESIQLFTMLSNLVYHCAHTAPLMAPQYNPQFPTCWRGSSVALAFRALHQLYLVFIILGQGKIKSGKTSLELGPRCSIGAAGAVQSEF